MRYTCQDEAAAHVNSVHAGWIHTQVAVFITIYHLLVSCFVLNEVPGLLLGNSINVADFVSETDSVALVSNLQQLRPKCGGDELCTVRQTMEHG